MILSGQACAESFITKKADGSLLAASVGPAGVLYVNGVANGAVVTITGANPYKWAVTLPALNVGDLAQMYITATVDAIPTAEFVWGDNIGIMPAVPGDAMNATQWGGVPVGGMPNSTTPPTVGQVADATWDELLAGHLGVGSTGEKLNAASAAGDPWSTALPGAYPAGDAGNIIGNLLANVWGYPIRTLTYPHADGATSQIGTVAITRAVTYTKRFTVVIPATWTKIWFTLKKSATQADTKSLVQVVVSNPGVVLTDGLLYLNAVAATAVGLAGLVVDQPNGTIDLTIKDEATALLDQDLELGYDVKCLKADGNTQLLEVGTASISLTETNAIA